MSPFTKSKVSLMCYMAVSKAFANANNPGRKKARYEWEDFPEQVVIPCHEAVMAQMYIKKSDQATVREYVESYSREIAQQLIDWMHR